VQLCTRFVLRFVLSINWNPYFGISSSRGPPLTVISKLSTVKQLYAIALSLSPSAPYLYSLCSSLSHRCHHPRNLSHSSNRSVYQSSPTWRYKHVTLVRHDTLASHATARMLQLFQHVPLGLNEVDRQKASRKGCVRLYAFDVSPL
jgi:hypothetical protein